MDDVCELPAFRTSDEEAGALLRRAKTIVVVGCSTNPEKPSHHVPRYLQQQGYRIVPVNPMAKGQQLLGETPDRCRRYFPAAQGCPSHR